MPASALDLERATERLRLLADRMTDLAHPGDFHETLARADVNLEDVVQLMKRCKVLKIEGQGSIYQVAAEWDGIRVAALVATTEVTLRDITLDILIVFDIWRYDRGYQ